MSDIAIKVEGLSKQYRIGEQERYKALRDVITDAATSPFRRMRSAFRNGNSTSPSSFEAYPNGGHPTSNTRHPSPTIWALDDVSFEVKRGEVVGIIGRNGAGKSTLLKILSRITKPTKGHATINGRVGSLLEVGTGFHPELTGRENIYLNAAILGMRKAEVAKKFDEIVAFAEVEKFIDTPVKRYSSGMYVRLAFAVAAHMDTEVLLVDEVLAVGDAQFQKKCLGKIGDVASKGRTVLFVSHQMAAVENLCQKGLLLFEGRVRMIGSANDVVRDYLTQSTNVSQESLDRRKDRQGNGSLRFTGVTLRNTRGEGSNVLSCGSGAVLDLGVRAADGRSLRSVRISVGVDNDRGHRILTLSTNLAGEDFAEVPKDVRGFQVSIPRLTLTPGRYSYTLFASVNGEVSDWLVNAGSFDVASGDYYGNGNLPPAGPGQGFFLMDHAFALSRKRLA
jgi:lipopolysaccharide transport system ATP-binding protein